MATPVLCLGIGGYLIELGTLPEYEYDDTVFYITPPLHVLYNAFDIALSMSHASPSYLVRGDAGETDSCLVRDTLTLV